MSKIAKCPVPPRERSIGYIHGWNKACKKSSECLDYPNNYTGVKFGANGCVIPPESPPVRRRVSNPTLTRVGDEKPVQRPRRAVVKRRTAKETREEKLSRARKKLLRVDHD